MMREKKVFSFRIYAPEDLTQKWYVEYYNPKRNRKYSDINRYKTYEERMARAKEVIQELKMEVKRMESKAARAAWEWFEREQPVWREKTRQQYKSMLTAYFDYLGEREPTAKLISNFFVQLRSKLHPTTYNRYLAIIKRVMKIIGYEFLMEEYSPLRARATPARYFQPFQAKRLMRRMQEEDPTLALAVKFIYYCFLRPKELRFLKAGDLLMEDREIRVRGETAKNHRTTHIVIPDSFFPDLLFLYKYSPNDWVFPGRYSNNPIGENTFYNRHKAILEDMNFGPGYSLYSWKHTGAVTLAKAGASLKEIQLQMRHHSVEQTDDYLRQMGVKDLGRLRSDFPTIWK
jgi:integrase